VVARHPEPDEDENEDRGIAGDEPVRLKVEGSNRKRKPHRNAVCELFL
jgi:hypothetical protein